MFKWLIAPSCDVEQNACHFHSQLAISILIVKKLCFYDLPFRIYFYVLLWKQKVQLSHERGNIFIIQPRRLKIWYQNPFSAGSSILILLFGYKVRIKGKITIFREKQSNFQIFQIIWQTSENLVLESFFDGEFDFDTTVWPQGQDQAVITISMENSLILKSFNQWPYLIESFQNLVVGSVFCSESIFFSNFQLTSQDQVRITIFRINSPILEIIQKYGHEVDQKFSKFGT